ncbi:MAG TPA: PQQ-binding-like beta-propeller repeat protein [Pirellulales bacterium]|nr:PQQ-binding-like beta-propeller repeat protein [Pirellulales bacterium]
MPAWLKLRGIVVLLVFAAAAWGEASQWTQWRGDHRDGVAHDSPPLLDALPNDGIMPLWMSERVPGGGDGGWGSPVIADSRLYLFTHRRTRLSEEKLPPRKYPYLSEDKRGHLTAEEYAAYEINRREEDRKLGELYEYHELVYCLDANTGVEIWKDRTKSVYTRFLHSGSPAVADARLYVLGAGRVAKCLDARSGKHLWETRLPGEFNDEYMMSSFAVADGVACVLAGQLFGLDAANGEILWQGNEQSTRGTHSSPVTWTVDGHEFFIVNVAGSSTICIEPRTGHERWRVKSDANLSTPLVVADKLITLGSQRRGGLRCFDLSLDGAKERWVYQRIADKGSSPVVVNGYVYAQGERRMCCVNLDTGDEAWNTMLDLASPQYTSLVAGDGKVIYAYDGVLVFAADPHEFHPLIAAKVDKNGRMATESEFRRLLKLDALEKTPGGLEKSTRVYQQEVGNQGPLPCSSPALVDGKLYLRLRQAVACYDLSAK